MSASTVRPSTAGHSPPTPSGPIGRTTRTGAAERPGGNGRRPSGPAGRRGADHSRWGLLVRASSPLGVVAVWAVVSGAGLVDPNLLPSPLTVARAAVRVTADGTLLEALSVSLGRVAVGLAVGLTLGLVLGVLVGLTRSGELLLDPTLQMLRTLPLLGLTPLLILWVGIGEAPKIILVAIGSLFPVYLNAVGGIHSVDGRLLEAGRCLGLGRGELVRHIVLPSALPQLLVGLRQALGIAWISLIVGEQINAASGLGHLINDAREYLQTDVVLVGLAVYALLGLLTDGAVRILERRALVWRP